MTAMRSTENGFVGLATKRGLRMKVVVVAVALLLTCCALAQSARAENGDWPMYNRDVQGTRHNDAEWRLSPFTVPFLREIWSVTTPGAVTGTPIIVDDGLYVGDWTGG